MKQRHLVLIWLLALIVPSVAQKRVPSDAVATRFAAPAIDHLLSISRVGWSTAISPDGKFIAYHINRSDFDLDVNVSQIWIADIRTGKSFPLTDGEDSFYQMQWSPDAKGIACLSAKLNQVVFIPVQDGKPAQLTSAPSGVTYFALSPDGKQLAFSSNEKEPEHLTKRKTTSGSFTIVGEKSVSHSLWMIDVTDAANESSAGIQLTTDISVSGFMAPFSWSPDGAHIAFSAASREDQDFATDIYILTLEDRKIKKLVSQPGRDRDPQWSPDGKKILFTSDMGKKGLDGYNYGLAVVEATGGDARSVTNNFVDTPRLVAWNKDGIYFWSGIKAGVHFFRLDPVRLTSTRIPITDGLVGGGFSLSEDGRMIAFTGSSATTIDEVYSFDLAASTIKKLTDMTAQVAGQALGRREVISWKNSEDGLEIEGVLTKPVDFNTQKKYPLMLVIHGGPSAASHLSLLNWRYYPIDLWVSRGAIVLEVNYRGSSGYGAMFRKSAFRSFLQEGADIMSGVDYLVNKGWVDTDKIGCMGWSHGGYLTALLASTTQRFRAVSVGAAVVDWASYHYNSPNGTELSIAYLGDTPLNDPDIYRAVSPLSYIKQYRTPTLIQHGDVDPLVPVSEAYRFCKAIKELGVKAEMIVYHGAGHGINKPRTLRAATQHNLYWFNHFLWGDPLPDFSFLKE